MRSELTCALKSDIYMFLFAVTVLEKITVALSC